MTLKKIISFGNHMIIFRYQYASYIGHTNKHFISVLSAVRLGVKLFFFNNEVLYMKKILKFNNLYSEF